MKIRVTNLGGVGINQFSAKNGLEILFENVLLQSSLPDNNLNCVGGFLAEFLPARLILAKRGFLILSSPLPLPRPAASNVKALSKGEREREGGASAEY